MKIFLVRHGESEANVADRINDDPSRPVNLTERGWAQATHAATLLSTTVFTHAYVSQFPRAQQTAAILLREHSLTPIIDERLNERHSGMDGMPVDSFNDLVRHDPLRTKPARGESFLEQMQRMRSFLDEVSQRHEAGVVIAVSHENPIVAALALQAEDPQHVIRRNISNCEWVELDWSAPRSD